MNTYLRNIYPVMLMFSLLMLYALVAFSNPNGDQIVSSNPTNFGSSALIESCYKNGILKMKNSNCEKKREADWRTSFFPRDDFREIIVRNRKNI